MQKTLQSIAETNAESFYKGHIADEIDAFSKKYNGFLSKEDLADFAPEWVKPISVNYKGYDVWEIPPNGQGLVALLALNMLKGFDYAARDTVETYHTQLEAMKLAFGDGLKYITQQDKMKVTVEDLLSETYTKQRREYIVLARPKHRLLGSPQEVEQFTWQRLTMKETWYPLFRVII